MAYYAFDSKLISKSNYYESKYGIVPIFKAGMHIGGITVVEVSELKFEIAYHGDAINTTSGIENMCNTWNAKLLVSKKLFDLLELDNSIKPGSRGKFKLRGKNQELEFIEPSSANEVG